MNQKRRSDEPGLTRKPQRTPPLQTERETTRDVSERPIVFFLEQSHESPCCPCRPHVRNQPPGFKPRSIALFQKGNSDPETLAPTRLLGHTPKPPTPPPSASQASPPLDAASGQSMSSTETLTQKWLRQNIATYNDGSRVFADVDSTLSLYPTLRPKTDVYSSVSCLEQSPVRPLIASICYL